MTRTQHVDDPTQASSQAPPVTLVTSPACHFCEDALNQLLELAAEDRITLDTVPGESDEGRRLLAAHRPTMFPLVLVAGRFFSQGRLPRRKLERLLTEGR